MNSWPEKLHLHTPRRVYLVAILTVDDFSLTENLRITTSVLGQPMQLRKRLQSWGLAVCDEEEVGHVILPFHREESNLD